jgi:hypothetical protein
VGLGLNTYMDLRLVFPSVAFFDGFQLDNHESHLVAELSMVRWHVADVVYLPSNLHATGRKNSN